MDHAVAHWPPREIKWIKVLNKFVMFALIALNEWTALLLTSKPTCPKIMSPHQSFGP
jgi:hypothetical protein